MLTGKRLFPAEVYAQAALAHARGPQLPADWLPGVPAGVATVLRNALAQRSEERYPTAAALYQALRDAQMATTRVTEQAKATIPVGTFAGRFLVTIATCAAVSPWRDAPNIQWQRKFDDRQLVLQMHKDRP
jgi:hypothetical protein